MPFDDDRSYARFPLWLELSGLPVSLNETAKQPYAWSVFKKLVELDLRQNIHQPGYIDVSMEQLEASVGIDKAKIEKAVKGMRKAGLVRAFLPDSDKENALFQFILPLATPLSADQVKEDHHDLFLSTHWPPRYTTVPPPEQEADKKINQVVDLYMNIFSMKMNNIILDQLKMISNRYDLKLVEKVFHKAREKEATSLSWILSEIRRELKVKEEAAKLRLQAEQGHS